LEGLTQIAKDFQAKVGFLLSECDGGAQHGFHFAQEALALVRVKGFGLLDGFMMMGVAFLLERSGAVVNSQTVADEDPAEVFSENVAKQLPSAALSDDIESEQRGSKTPQPPARAGAPPAGFVAMKYRCLAQFGRDGVVLGLDFASEPIQCLGKPAGTQLQAKAIVQDGTGFSHRESLCLVEISGESQGAGSEVCAGSAGGQRHLQRMAGTDILTTPGTGGLVSNQPCHMRTHRRNVFDKLFELRLINKLLSPAVRTSTELNFNALIDMIGV